MARKTAAKKTAVDNALPNGRMTFIVEIDGEEIGRFNASGRQFKSGSLGYHANGKVELDADHRFQVNLQAVLIGSKPKD